VILPERFARTTTVFTAPGHNPGFDGLDHIFTVSGAARMASTESPYSLLQGGYLVSDYSSESLPAG
jgi:muramidase (phage lysozyme)